VVDESETGSANFWSEWGLSSGLSPPSIYISSMHLRPPSIDPGVTSFIWAFGLALFIWLGQLAVGVSSGTALVIALLSFGAMFLFIRLHGGDDPVR
jgi:hypothetical protein